jgi:indole-3-glycerol phosphate synthase
MSSILQKIISEKEKEVERLSQLTFDINQNKKLSMYNSFKENNQMNIIAEIKRASPSKGMINTNVNPVKQAIDYVNYGANAISVLTDETFFKGSIDDLIHVREVVDVPILCKDFIINTKQIDRANAAGADVVLLIVAALSPIKLIELYEYALEKKLEVLLEVHNEEELKLALAVGAKMIGINNRNLKTFDVDLAVTERLVRLINDEEVLVISESGIKSAEDVLQVKNAGAKGILVGETLMRSKNLKETFSQLKVEKVNKL